MCHRAALICCLASMLAFFPKASHTEESVTSRWEAEPELDAAELVAPSLLAGPDYRIEPQAQVVGYQARFSIRTPWGTLVAESVEMLGVRIAEMPAVAALHDASVSETLADASAAVAKEAGAGIWRVARHPVDTVTGVPKGVGRYFLRQWRKLDDRLTRLGDRLHRRMAEDGDPYGDATGPLAGTRVGDPETSSWYDRPVREGGRLVRSELGYGRARRELAHSLGIDPATSNPLIEPRLDALAWARVGGRKAGSFALGGLGGGVTDALGDVGRIDDIVWSLDPDDLRARNEARLSRWCDDAVQRRRFLGNGSFTPSLQTAFVDALSSLEPASGCEAMLDMALMARSEVEARFVIGGLRLAQAYLGPQAHGVAIVPLDSTLMLRTASGEWVLPLAVDWLSWTQDAEAFFDAPGMPDTSPTLLVSGQVSLRAQRELTRRGYSLVMHLPYPGAPPYAVSPAGP